FVSMKLAELLGGSHEGKSVVSCHLGNGTSITAIKDGKSVDTSMGFTPLDGIIMGTRSGAVDPSAVTYVQKKLGLTPDQMSDYLNKKSGFLGLSDGLSSDNRAITAGIAEGNEKCILVSEMLTYGIKKYIGSYAAAMNGLDAIIFTGGIGENAPEVRQAVCENMEVFGIKIDPEANLIRGELRKISTEDNKVEVWVIPTNEELLIARDTLAVAGLDKNA
ncbi:MAG: acetate kinase, partial [Ruminiclostridium sp.]|nr:acetate kinase [Ruminiclostridium sp.]